MANQIIRTELVITTNDTDYQVPGDMSPQALITAYGASIPGLSSMVHESREEYRADLGGYVRVVTFKPRTGTKG